MTLARGDSWLARAVGPTRPEPAATTKDDKDGRACRYRLRCHLGARFKGARNRLWLTTPYFLLDSGTQRDLCRAASHGVDVRVLVPGKNDVPFVQWAARAAYSRLLAAWAPLLPGFEWLTWTGFVIGLVEVYLYGWYLAVLFVPLYRWFSRNE